LVQAIGEAVRCGDSGGVIIYGAHAKGTIWCTIYKAL